MAVKLKERYPISEGDKVSVAINFDGRLDADETLTLVETVNPAAELEITNEHVNEEAVLIKGESVAEGKAAHYTFTGQLEENSPYEIQTRVTTSKEHVFNVTAEFPVV